MPERASYSVFTIHWSNQIRYGDTNGLRAQHRSNRGGRFGLVLRLMTGGGGRCVASGAVRRHEGRRGRPLDVLVEWEGEDSDGDLWEESWISVTE
jgi:hypothetical protein